MKEKAIEGFQNRKYGLLAALLTACAAVVIFSISRRLIGGAYIFMRGDLMGQYVPFFHQFLNSLFGPEDLDYSFYISMGMPTMAVYACNCLSPLNLLYLLIADPDIASVCIVIGKLALAAYTFQWFSRKYLGNASVSSVAFAMGYALCSYSVTYYHNIMFLDSVYMLPVIMGLVILFVKEGKWRALTAAYAYLFLVNFYTAYMVGFFSFVLLIVLMAGEYGKSWKRYAVTGFRFAGVVVWAALMGAAFLAPAAYTLLWNNAPDATEFGRLLLTLPDLYGNLFLGQMQSLEGIFPMIYCGVAVVYLIPLFFMDRHYGRKEKMAWIALFIFLVICSFWLPGYIFIHAFDAPDSNGYRFGFLYSFLLAAVCCAQWNRIGASTEKRSSKKSEKKSNKKSEKTLAVIAVINIALYYLIYLWQKQNLREAYQSMSMLGWELNIFFLILLLIIMRYAKQGDKAEKKAGKILVVVMALELIVNGFFCVTRASYTQGEYKTVYDTWTDSAEETLRAIRQADDGFYRIRYQNAFMQDQSALFDYMDIPYFSTIENWRMRNTLGMLGFSVSPRCASDAGWTPVTEMLFAQRYVVMGQKPWEQEGDMTVFPYYRNETALGLGYMVSEGLREVVLQDNAMENLNQVIQGMTGEDIVCMIPYTGEIGIQSENMALGWEEGIYTLRKEDEAVSPSRLSYHIESGTDDAYVPYAYFSQKESVMMIQVPLLYGVNGTYLTTPAILQMESGDGIDSVYIEMDEISSSEAWYQNHYFAYYDPAALQEAYETLKDHQLMISERRGSRIRGTVEAVEGRTVLFTSIPYDEGWRIYVDREKAETEALINGAFLGVELMPGFHEVEMVYQSSLNTVSAWVSAAACAAFLLAATMPVMAARKDGGKKKAEAEEEEKKSHGEITNQGKNDTNKNNDKQYLKRKKTTGQRKK